MISISLSIEKSISKNIFDVSQGTTVHILSGVTAAFIFMTSDKVYRKASADTATSTSQFKHDV